MAEEEALMMAEAAEASEAGSTFSAASENLEATYVADASEEQVKAAEEEENVAADAMTEEVLEQEATKSGEEAPSSEEVKGAVEELNSVRGKPASEVLSTAESAETGANSKTLKKISESFEKQSDVVSKGFDKTLEKSLSGDGKAKLKEIKGEVSDLNDQMKDAYEAKDAAKMEEISNKMEELTKDMESLKKSEPKFKEELDAKGKSATIAEKIWKWAKVIGVIGGIGGLFLALWLISKDLTGCYMYTGTDSVKIDCPTSAKTCGCGDAKKDVSDPQELSKLCSGYKDYPFCCDAPSPARPTCSSGTPGRDGVVFYTYKVFTPGSILANLPKSIVNFGKDLVGGLGGMLKKILMYVGIGVAVLVGLYILFFVLRFVGTKMMAKKSSKFISVS